MLKSFKRFFNSNYEKMKLPLGMWLGLLAILFYAIYLIGYLTHIWQYYLTESVLLPVSTAIITGVPLFGLIIILRFINYYKTRRLFYMIAQKHRHQIKFQLQSTDGNNPNNEIQYILWGIHKESLFRFSYSLGQPLTISLIIDVREYDIIKLNKFLSKSGIKGRAFNAYGLAMELKRPFSKKKIKSIPDSLELLIKDADKIFRILYNR